MRCFVRVFVGVIYNLYTTASPNLLHIYWNVNDTLLLLILKAISVPPSPFLAGPA